MSTSWEANRRTVLKAAAASAALTQVPALADAALAGIIRDLGPLPALDVVRHPRVGSDAKRAGCCLAVRHFALSPMGR